MFIATWIGAALVGAIHLLAGSSMLAKPDDRLPRNAARTIGILQILGAIGIIAPKLTHIAEWLSPTAAFCFVALQIGAAIFHIRRREFRMLPVNFVIAAAAAFVGLSWLSWV